MHRETLSRSLFLSHNLLGKVMTTFAGARGNIMRGKPAPTSLLSLCISTSVASSSRCYHTTLEKPAQSVTKTIISDAHQKGTSSKSNSSHVERNNGGGKESSTKPVFQKQFNIQAKDILSTPDEPALSATPLIDDTSVANRSLLETRIYAARTIEDLLNFSSERDLTLRHACIIISRLGNLSLMRTDRSQVAGIQADKRFIRIFNLIQRGNHSQFPHTLLQALSGLQKLGLETSEEVSKLLEQELGWSMRRCPLRFLAKSVRILHDNKLAEKAVVSGHKSNKDKSVLQAAVQVLHRRWIEAFTGGDFISLLQIIELVDEDTKLKIEERAADVAHQFTPMEIIKMFVILGQKKRRPTPLLRALSFHYGKSEWQGSAKDLIELIYALNELTFADPILMNRLCTDISEQISRAKNVTLISSLMTSLGQMRYKHREVLRAVDEWIVKHLDKLRPFDYAAWLQAAATLNHQSENLRGFSWKAQLFLTPTSVSSPTDWVNVVHSFVIIDNFKNDILSTVLNASFVESIERLGPKATKQKVKLLNLNCLASIRKAAGDYNGPLLEDNIVKHWTATLVNSNDDKLSKLLVDSLSNFLPLAKYLEVNQQLECGVFVDVKCYVDNKLIPMTLEAATSEQNSTTAQKIAFVVDGYSAMCLGLKHPTGHSMLNVKILEAQNFIVVTIPYMEFGQNDKLIRRVQYLEQKLKAISHTKKSPSVASSNLT